MQSVPHIAHEAASRRGILHMKPLPVAAERVLVGLSACRPSLTCARPLTTERMRQLTIQSIAHGDDGHNPQFTPGNLRQYNHRYGDLRCLWRKWSAGPSGAANVPEIC